MLQLDKTRKAKKAMCMFYKHKFLGQRKKRDAAVSQFFSRSNN